MTVFICVVSLCAVLILALCYGCKFIEDRELENLVSGQAPLLQTNLLPTNPSHNDVGGQGEAVVTEFLGGSGECKYSVGEGGSGSTPIAVKTVEEYYVAAKKPKKKSKKKVSKNKNSKKK